MASSMPLLSVLLVLSVLSVLSVRLGRLTEIRIRLAPECFVAFCTASKQQK